MAENDEAPKFDPTRRDGPDTRQPRYMMLGNLPAAATEPVVEPLHSTSTLWHASKRIPLGIVHDANGGKLEVMVNFGTIGSELAVASVVRKEAVHEEDQGRWALAPGSGEGADSDAIIPLDPHGNKAVTMDVAGSSVVAQYDSLRDELMVGPAAIGDGRNQGLTVTIPVLPTSTA